MKMLKSSFYCTKCGNKGIPIFRSDNRIRESGHLKKLYCLYCKQETNHAECKEKGKYTYNEFLIEFNNNNFTENGLRRQPWRQFIASTKR